MKYSDREYQERINNIEKDKDILKVFICLQEDNNIIQTFYSHYISIKELLTNMRNVYPNNNEDFFPEHNEYIKKSSSENIFIMNNNTFHNHYNEGNSILSTLRV